MSFEVLSATNMKMADFWDVILCSPVCIEHLMMETVNCSETSVSTTGLHWATSQKTAIFLIAVSFTRKHSSLRGATQFAKQFPAVYVTRSLFAVSTIVCQSQLSNATLWCSQNVLLGRRVFSFLSDIVR
jgi:hypothetical protein